MVTILDSNGATLGQSTQGGVSFTYPQPGFGVSVSLPTNGWIDRLVITADFAEPADSPSIDVLDDGSTEWSFPFGSDYGHYGWQSLIVEPSIATYGISKAGALRSAIVTPVAHHTRFRSLTHYFRELRVISRRNPVVGL